MIAEHPYFAALFGLVCGIAVGWVACAAFGIAASTQADPDDEPTGIGA
ncbi:MAG: hypothetical protein ABFD96_25030 [Armatimonadia bacterium]